VFIESCLNLFSYLYVYFMQFLHIGELNISVNVTFLAKLQFYIYS